MSENSVITPEAITILGWFIGAIGFLILGVCTLVLLIIIRIWNKSESTADKLSDLMATCKKNHGGE